MRNQDLLLFGTKINKYYHLTNILLSPQVRQSRGRKPDGQLTSDPTLTGLDVSEFERRWRLLRFEKDEMPNK